MLTSVGLLLQCVFSSDLFSSSRDALNVCLASAFLYAVFMVLSLSMLFEIEKSS